MKPFLSYDTSLLEEAHAQVVVCGSGIGGLTTAITLRELGLEPILLTKGLGNTYYSQGGIACAVDPKDSPYLHYLDTLRAGRGLCKQEAVRDLVEEGIQRASDLVRWGVAFDPEPTLEGGHSYPRVLRVKDYTGRAIYQALWKRLEGLKVRVVEGELVEVLGDEGVCGVLYVQEGRLKLLRTRALVLATGGAGSLFSQSSNWVSLQGDGMGLALRLGVPLENPEFVQFHPTVLYGTNFLISEAVRGEGALLVDEKGERFVDELLPRDLVARAIYRKLKEGGKVFLDLRPLKEKGIDIKERFPTIYEFLVKRGYNPYTEPVPVSPAAHYFIGGIRVDLWGRTGYPGLYAVGECAHTGVHGANRLASNSLLEGLVFGYRTAHRILWDLPHLKPSNSHFKNVREGYLKPPHTYEDLKRLMWEKCGVERHGRELKEGIETLEGWLEGWHMWEPTLENRRLLDLTLLALACFTCAFRRQESRGVHLRLDYPYEREELRQPSLYFIGL